MKTLRSLLSIRLLILSVVVAIASGNLQDARGDEAPAKSAETAAASPTNLRTIDNFAEALQKQKPTPEATRAILTPLVAAPFKNVVVANKKLGIASTIQITFEMLSAKTKLADVTKQGETWGTGPLLPDSGQCPVSRDWTWSQPQKMTLKCSAIVENCDSLQTAQIEGEITCFLDRVKKK